MYQALAKHWAFDLLTVLAVLNCPIATAADDSTVVAGDGFGIVKLGMDRDKITDTLGKRDGKYSLPNGIQVEYSTWKEPGTDSTVRVFFDAAGKVVQLSGHADSLATADGISTKSTLSEVRKRYPELRLFEYRAKATHVEYYDDVKHGIAFEFAWADLAAKSNRRMYAILVHLPNRRVIPESDERPVKPPAPNQTKSERNTRLYQRRKS